MPNIKFEESERFPPKVTTMNRTATVKADITHQAMKDDSISAGNDSWWRNPPEHQEITIQDHHGQPIHVSCDTVAGIEIQMKNDIETGATNSVATLPSSAVNLCVVFDAGIQQTADHLNMVQPVCTAATSSSVVSATVLNSSTPTQGKEKNFVCDCGQSFSKKSNLTTHMKVHSAVKPFQCNICLKRFAHKQNRDFHIRRHTGERPYKCDKCERAFICVALLNRHKREHDGNYAHRCTICDQGFILKRNYVEHMNAHTNTRPFQCSICDKSFSRREPLRVHMKIHTRETPFTCKECGKAFALRTRLDIHMRRHTGETPYMCLDCGKAFYTSPQLNSHQRRYQGSCRQDQFFQCPECGASFTKQCGLSAHMRIHQPSSKNSLSCDQCKREFSSQRQLSIHSLYHDTTLPHHCTDCLLYFPTQNSYKRHRCIKTGQTESQQQQHTVNGPKNGKCKSNVKQKYTCSLCNKSLTSAHGLKRHLKTHEKESHKTKTLEKKEQTA